MAKKFYCFLTHAGKNEEVVEEVDGVEIEPKSAKLYKLLENIFYDQISDKHIPIAFIADGNGTQNNEMRDIIIEHLKKRTLHSGLAMGERLQSYTTNVSGMGLLFIMTGKFSGKIRIVISRFPADVGIMADRGKGGLKVELIEKVFMKDAFSYKSAVYEETQLNSPWWEGYAIDKQISYGAKCASNYWIREFLLSDFLATSRAGTRRLALAMRDSIRDEGNKSIQAELISVATLLNNQNGEPFSLKKLFKNFSLSQAAKDAILKRYPKSTVNEHFTFDLAEYSAHAAIRHVNLNTGASLSAPVHTFDEIIEMDEDLETGITEFRTKGKVKRQRISGEDR